MHTESPLPIRIITHNIRYDASRWLFPGEALWKTRLPLLVNHFRYHTSQFPTALLCLQEVLREQLVDILGHLNSAPSTSPSEWASIGVGRDDGVSAGEYAVILYRPAVWKVLETDTIWLSETPHVPGSKGWDASSVRIVTVASLRHRESRRELVVLNTHLDDQGVLARTEAAKMLRNVAQKWSASGKRALVLSGDLNSEADGDAYRVLTGPQHPSGTTMLDVRERCEYRYGEENTFKGLAGKKKDLTRLDYIFVNLADADKFWQIGGYTVASNRFEDGVYHSDHRAVIVDLKLQ